MTRSDLERSFRCGPLGRQREEREAKISNAYVDIEKHFRNVGTVEIFDLLSFPIRPPPRALNYGFCLCNLQMARVDTHVRKAIGEFLTYYID